MSRTWEYSAVGSRALKVYSEGSTPLYCVFLATSDKWGVYTSPDPMGTIAIDQMLHDSLPEAVKVAKQHIENALKGIEKLNERRLKADKEIQHFLENV